MTTQPNPKAFHFEIMSEPEAIAPLRQQIREHLLPTGLPVKTVDAIMVAFGEACSNVVRHAYEGKGGQKIEIDLLEKEDRVLIKIRDFGKKLEMDKVKVPDLPPTKPGGLGVYFMKTIMDQVEYNASSTQGNELILTKYKVKGATA